MSNDVPIYTVVNIDYEINKIPETNTELVLITLTKKLIDSDFNIKTIIPLYLNYVGDGEFHYLTIQDVKNIKIDCDKHDEKTIHCLSFQLYDNNLIAETFYLSFLEENYKLFSSFIEVLTNFIILKKHIISNGVFLNKIVSIFEETPLVTVTKPKSKPKIKIPESKILKAVPKQKKAKKVVLMSYYDDSLYDKDTAKIIKFK